MNAGTVTVPGAFAVVRRRYFVFCGWYTEEGKEWNFAEDRVYYSMTLYAKWVPAEDRPPLNPSEPVKSVETPVEIFAVLAGLGAAAVFGHRMRR